MIFFIAWIFVLTIVFLIVGLIKPKFLAGLIPVISLNLTRRHVVLIFIPLILISFFLLDNLAFKEKDEDSSADESQEENEIKDEVILSDKDPGDAFYYNPGFQDGVYIPPYEGPIEENQEEEISPSEIGSEIDSDVCAGITCSGNGICKEVNNNAECFCNTGYHPDGLKCIKDDINPCSGVVCGVNSSCSEGVCVCNSGYEKNASGQCILIQSDPCEGITCGAMGTCVEGVCKCINGADNYPDCEM